MQARMCGPHGTDSPDPWDVQGTELQPPNPPPGDEDQPVVFAPQLRFQRRGFPLLRSAGTQEMCTTTAYPLAVSSWATGAFPGSHQTRLFAKHFHTKPPLVGKGDTAHPAATEPTPYGTRCPVLSRAKLSQAGPSHWVGPAGPPGCSHAPLGRRGQRTGGQPCPGRLQGRSMQGSALR